MRLQKLNYVNIFIIKEIKEKDKIVNILSLYKYDEKEVMSKTIG